MRGSAMASREQNSLVARIAWVLAGATSLFAFENVWVDPWIAKKSHHRLPSFVPESLGGAWVLTFALLGITLILGVVCQVLLLRDKGFAGWKKVMTGFAVLVAAVLAGEWFIVTGGRRLTEQMRWAQKSHTVTLRWQAGTLENVRYNGYRGPRPGVHRDKLNDTPIEGLTFTDTRVEKGAQYYYVARAVDHDGHESADSNETSVTIP